MSGRSLHDDPQECIKTCDQKHQSAYSDCKKSADAGKEDLYGLLGDCLLLFLTEFSFNTLKLSLLYLTCNLLSSSSCNRRLYLLNGTLVRSGCIWIYRSGLIGILNDLDLIVGSKPYSFPVNRKYVFSGGSSSTFSIAFCTICES